MSQTEGLTAELAWAPHGAPWTSTPRLQRPGTPAQRTGRGGRSGSAPVLRVASQLNHLTSHDIFLRLWIPHGDTSMTSALGHVYLQAGQKLPSAFEQL